LGVSDLRIRSGRGSCPWAADTVGSGRVPCPRDGATVGSGTEGRVQEREGGSVETTHNDSPGGTGGIGRSATIPREHTRDPHTQGQGEHSKADRGFMTNRLWPFGCALPGGLRGTEETDSRREGEGK
jgi:hypothetical protein